MGKIQFSNKQTIISFYLSSDYSQETQEIKKGGAIASILPSTKTSHLNSLSAFVNKDGKFSLPTSLGCSKYVMLKHIKKLKSAV